MALSIRYRSSSNQLNESAPGLTQKVVKPGSLIAKFEFTRQEWLIRSTCFTVWSEFLSDNEQEDLWRGFQKLDQSS